MITRDYYRVEGLSFKSIGSSLVINKIIECTSSSSIKNHHSAVFNHLGFVLINLSDFAIDIIKKDFDIEGIETVLRKWY